VYKIIFYNTPKENGCRTRPTAAVFFL